MPNVSGTADRSNLSVTYEDDQGNRTVKSGGKRPWRNNNPGNIIKGETADRLGAIGDDGTFAIFPDVATGAKAMQSLLKGSRYQSLSLGDAIARWSADRPKALEEYRKLVEDSTGVSRDRPMSSLTPEEFARVVDAMQRQEGFWAPDPQTRKKIILEGDVSHQPIRPRTAPEKTTPPGGLRSIDRAVEHGARQSRAPVPAPAKPVTGLDRLQEFFGRPFEHLVKTARGRVPVDDPAILHADEIEALMAAPAYRQSLHPQADKTRATVGGWFEATYPGPVQYDATGRMISAPRRERPQSAPSWVRDQGPLSLQGVERYLLTGAPIPGGRRLRRKSRTAV